MILLTTRDDKLVLVSSMTPFMMKSAGNPDGLDIELFDAMTADMVKDPGKWVGELDGMT